jgi:RNA polymerase primary sigma factor
MWGPITVRLILFYGGVYMKNSIGMAKEEALGFYFSELGSFQSLTGDKERELFMVLENNKASANRAWKTARENIISSYLRFVVHLAKKYRNRGLDFADLIQEGSNALIRALDRFNPAAGKRFIAYAAPWIQGAMIQAIYDQSCLIRVPQYLQKDVSGEHGTFPIVEFFNGFDDVTSHYRTPETEFIYNERKRELKKAIDTLGEREKFVIKSRYFEPETAAGAEGQTLAALSEKLGVSHQRVAQIEKTALKKMETCLRGYDPKDIAA